MTTSHTDFGRRLVTEALGTGFLLAIVIGSGMMGERLAGGNVAVALLANTVATGARAHSAAAGRRGLGTRVEQLAGMKAWDDANI